MPENVASSPIPGRGRATAILGGQEPETAEIDPQRLKLALTDLPARLHRARRVFRGITGLTAVVSLRSVVSELGDTPSLSPPLHPRCLHGVATVADAPCNEQWSSRVHSSLRSRRSHSATCPLGLRCACVPIYLGGALVGVAKVVASRDTTAEAFSSAAATLTLAISSACQESYTAILWEELQALRQCASGFRRSESPAPRSASDPKERTASTGGEGGTIGSDSIVDRALDLLHQRFTEPDLSLGAVAAALECSPNYLTQRFTRVVGQRMRGYIIALRLARVCHQLRATDLPIKRIALESGFRDTAGLSRSFRRHLGVSPSEYRRSYAGGLAELRSARRARSAGIRGPWIEAARSEFPRRSEFLPTVLNF